jgi:hypothetical protein
VTRIRHFLAKLAVAGGALLIFTVSATVFSTSAQRRTTTDPNAPLAEPILPGVPDVLLKDRTAAAQDPPSAGSNPIETKSAACAWTMEQFIAELEEYFRTDNGPSAFGNIVARADPNALLAKPTTPYEVIAVGADLTSNWSNMEQYVTTFNNAGYAYRGVGQNSNTFASAALAAGNLPPATGVAVDPSTGAVVVHWTPSLNQPLNESIGNGASYEPVSGINYNSITEQDGSVRYTGTGGSGVDGTPISVSLHINPQNLIDSVSARYFSGRVTNTVYDVDDQQPWIQQTTTFDPAGNLNSIATINDDLSKTSTEYDANNTQPWSQQTTWLDPQGRQTELQTINDNGTSQIQYWDVQNTQSWSNEIEQLNSLGQETSLLAYNDDGGTTTYTWDVMSQFTWFLAKIDRNSQGQNVDETTYNRNGTTIYNWDTLNQQTWSIAQTDYDGYGQRRRDPIPAHRWHDHIQLGYAQSVFMVLHASRLRRVRSAIGRDPISAQRGLDRLYLGHAKYVSMVVEADGLRRCLGPLNGCDRIQR